MISLVCQTPNFTEPNFIKETNTDKRFIPRYVMVTYRDNITHVINPYPFYLYDRGIILPLNNLSIKERNQYVKAFIDGLYSKGYLYTTVMVYIEKSKEMTYARININSINEIKDLAIRMNANCTLRPFYRTIHLIDVDIAEEKKDYYTHNDHYSPYPCSFRSIISYKNWLQSGFAEYGWDFWTGVLDKQRLDYVGSKAMYNACLLINHGKHGRRIPSAKIFFKEMKKIERRAGIRDAMGRY